MHVQIVSRKDQRRALRISESDDRLRSSIIWLLLDRRSVLVFVEQNRSMRRASFSGRLRLLRTCRNTKNKTSYKYPRTDSYNGKHTFQDPNPLRSFAIFRGGGEAAG
jgi:hypothetical protein